MGMFSEIATELTIRTIVQKIATELQALALDSTAREPLQRVGLFALAQFEWSTPEWATEYFTLFNGR